MSWKAGLAVAVLCLALSALLIVVIVRHNAAHTVLPPAGGAAPLGQLDSAQVRPASPSGAKTASEDASPPATSMVNVHVTNLTESTVALTSGRFTHWLPPGQNTLLILPSGLQTLQLAVAAPEGGETSRASASVAVEEGVEWEVGWFGAEGGLGLREAAASGEG